MGAPEPSFQAVTCAWPETPDTFTASSVCPRLRSMLLSLLSVFSYFFQKPPKAMSKPEGENQERTFIAIKPDGVQRGLVGKIIARFEEKGFKLVALKFMQASEAHLQEHYSDLSKKPFFPGLVKYMASGPLVAMVWEGLGAVKTGRKMLGETNPADSLPGTIRGDYCIQVGRNICHGSDSVESAQKEIKLWFKDAELVCYKSCESQWLYE